jgi:hypothetical protein
MIAEGAPDMMIFSMNVIGDGATHCEHLRARCHGKHPSSRDKKSLNVPEQNTRLDHQTTGVLIKLTKMVQIAGDPEISAGIETYIPVTSTHSIGKPRQSLAREKAIHPLRFGKRTDGVPICAQSPPGDDPLHLELTRKT